MATSRPSLILDTVPRGELPAVTNTNNVWLRSYKTKVESRGVVSKWKRNRHSLMRLETEDRERVTLNLIDGVMHPFKYHLTRNMKTFKSMLGKEIGMKESLDNVIDLPDMYKATMEDLIKYSNYPSIISRAIEPERIVVLYRLADMYEDKALMTACDTFIWKCINLKDDAKVMHFKYRARMIETCIKMDLLSSVLDTVPAAYKDPEYEDNNFNRKGKEKWIMMRTRAEKNGTGSLRGVVRIMRLTVKRGQSEVNPGEGSTRYGEKKEDEKLEGNYVVGCRTRVVHFNVYIAVYVWGFPVLTFDPNHVKRDAYRAVANTTYKYCLDGLLTRANEKVYLNCSLEQAVDNIRTLQPLPELDESRKLEISVNQRREANRLFHIRVLKGVEVKVIVMARHNGEFSAMISMDEALQYACFSSYQVREFIDTEKTPLRQSRVWFVVKLQKISLHTVIMRMKWALRDLLDKMGISENDLTMSIFSCGEGYVRVVLPQFHSISRACLWKVTELFVEDIVLGPELVIAFRWKDDMYENAKLSIPDTSDMLSSSRNLILYRATSFNCGDENTIIDNWLSLGVMPVLASSHVQLICDPPNSSSKLSDSLVQPWEENGPDCAMCFANRIRCPNKAPE